MEKGIEWALSEARGELRQAGLAFRREDLKKAWGHTERSRVESYEKTCNELRQVITELEAAARVVRIVKGDE